MRFAVIILFIFGGIMHAAAAEAETPGAVPSQKLVDEIVYSVSNSDDTIIKKYAFKLRGHNGRSTTFSKMTKKLKGCNFEDSNFDRNGFQATWVCEVKDAVIDYDPNSGSDQRCLDSGYQLTGATWSTPQSLMLSLVAFWSKDRCGASPLFDVPNARKGE